MPLTFIKGSDAHECRIELDGTGEDMGSRMSFIKMDIRPRDTADEVFRALRLALINGYSRIIEHPTEGTYNYSASGRGYCIPKKERIDLLKSKELRPTILGMTIWGEGSYAHEVQIRLNPYLNCIVGSGGKSTIVRMIGYAFGAQGFMETTPKRWLPEMVRIFWQQEGEVFCIERKGRNISPNNPEVNVRWLQLNDQAEWQEIEEWNDIAKENLPGMVEIWPHPKEVDAFKHMSEDKLIQKLVKSLEFKKVEGVRPLLVNQPRDIFDNAKVFNAVLSKPLLKARQIIWSTGSVNVPAALDSEKIVITSESKNRKQMEILCAGDLHEDEICEQFVNHFEGGWAGFARRSALYAS
jgi:hypothetical protein